MRYGRWWRRVVSASWGQRALGCTFPSPFQTMSFLVLSVIPKLKITDRGPSTSTASRSCPWRAAREEAPKAKTRAFAARKWAGPPIEITLD
jgi:hypothetical protein